MTNRLDWEKTLDPRILSFLKKADIIFEPYDALDLLEILKLRAKKALRKDKVDQVALKKVAAYASRETGDARKAVELLAKAVKVAEETSGYLGVKEVDIAENRLEVDKSTEMITALATQQRLALQACYRLFRKGAKKVSTGQAYEVYKNICHEQGCRALTQRRFCDIISFLDLYGLINARVVSMGRYGKTREIMSSLLKSAEKFEYRMAIRWILFLLKTMDLGIVSNAAISVSCELPISPNWKINLPFR